MRNAIENADNNAQTHAGCAAGSGADTITFDPGVFATPQTIVVSSALPDLTDNATTTIDGGNRVTVSGNDATRVFWIGDLGSGSGSAIIRNLVISHALGSGYGGGMFMTGTELELDHVTFADNATDLGGGGLASQQGIIMIHDCLFTGNSTATYIGGGYYFQGTDGDVTYIDRTTFAGNTAGSGGGAMSVAYGGDVHVTNSTFTDNASSSGYGAAIRNFKVSSLSLDFVTIAGNTASGSNGALDVENDGTIALSNSIVAENAGNDCRDSATGTGLTDAGGNFFGDTTCNGSADGNPMLGPLVMSAGLTPTMAPQSGSPVIDATACEAGVTADQRGISRPQGSGCDIGAVEVEASLFADGFDGP